MVGEGDEEPENIELWLVSLDDAISLPDEIRLRIDTWGYDIADERSEDSRWGLSPFA